MKEEVVEPVFPKPIPNMSPAEYALAKEGLCPDCKNPTQTCKFGDALGTVITDEFCAKCGKHWLTDETRPK